jgi:hypothetical protein
MTAFPGHAPNGGRRKDDSKAPNLIGVLHLQQAPCFPYGELTNGFPHTESLLHPVQRIQPGTEEKNRGAFEKALVTAVRL